MNLRQLILGGLFLGALAAPAGAQMNTEEVKERGRALVAMWWDDDGDGLWEAMTEGFQAQVGSIETVMQSRADLLAEFGEEAEVLEEVVLPAGDNMAYWRIVDLEQAPEPFIFHIVLQPDGQIALGRGGFESEVGRPPAVE